MFSWVPLVSFAATTQFRSPLFASTELAIALPTGTNAPPIGAVPKVMNSRVELSHPEILMKVAASARAMKERRCMVDVGLKKKISKVTVW